jgi:uncharacterized membrane protein
MNSLATADLVFSSAFAAAALAMHLARRLPAAHLGNESKEVVKLGLGLIATLTALVLGLLVASAKATFDSQDASVKDLATTISLLDRFLKHYGPETKELRDGLRQIVAATRERLWPDERHHTADLSIGAEREVADQFFGQLMDLQPKTDAQIVIKARSIDLATEMAQTRYRMYAHQQNSVPTQFLVVLVFWIIVLFAGFGLLAPRNVTVIAVLMVCAISISAAVYLVLELGRPFGGVIQVPNTSIQQALSQIGK